MMTDYKKPKGRQGSNNLNKGKGSVDVKRQASFNPDPVSRSYFESNILRFVEIKRSEKN